ncbi:MAG TPA: DUF481 domain-containing protein [Alcaligenes sp.]|nr:DUF481 domain-containing protein [Alcaligenes sp.]HRL27139.1 DUF481 domain-containing protein [Alcaligenes sp.]
MIFSLSTPYRTWLSLLGLVSVTSLAQAQETDSALQVTPYIWISGLKGDVSPFRRSPTVGVEKSFNDVWRDLNAGGFINVWARRERYVFSADLLYVDTTESRIKDGLPLLGALEGKVDNRLFMTSVQGGYRVLESERGSLDMLAGVSFWDVNTQAHLRTGPVSVTHKENFNWLDPMIGLRAFWHLNEQFSLQAQGSVGGFGAGSRHSHQAVFTVNYDLSERFSLAAGYKVLDVNYRRSGHVFDTRMSGPVLGLTWRF